MGIALLPQASLPGGPADDLVRVLPEAFGRERSVRAVVPAALSEVPRIRAVLEEIRSFVRGAGSHDPANRGPSLQSD
jgi:DNA-binding transcriptional LysR family regulator